MKRNRIKGTSSAMLVVFIVSGIAIIVLGFRQVHRLTTAPAWIAAGPLSAGQVITEDFLKKGRSSNSQLLVAEPRALLGKVLKVSKDEGEPFLATDLVTPPRSWLAEKAPEGRVLYTLTPQASTIPYTQLRNGDRLDVIARGARGVRTVAQDVLLIGALQPAQGNDSNSRGGRGLLTSLAQMPGKDNAAPQAGVPLILAVAPKDVYPLASIGMMEAVTLVLHGDHEKRKGKFLNVKPEPTRRVVQVYSGLEQESAIVKR